MEKKEKADSRKRDPFLDRRSGEDRRQVHNLDYFLNGGIERRKDNERRAKDERRQGCSRISQWSSICPDEPDKDESVEP
jgi:hypothetical protein